MSQGTGTITSLNGTVAAGTEGFSTVSFIVTGTWSASLILEATLDDQNWFSIQGINPTNSIIFSVFSVNLQVTAPCGSFSQVRLRAYAFTSGTINVSWDTSNGNNSIVTIVAGYTTTNPPVYLPNNTAQISLNTGGGIRTEQMLSTRQYYGVGTGAFTPPATPTDVATIIGSATKTIRVTKLELSSTQSTAGINTWFIIVRSAANSGGTSSTPTIVPFDSNNAAATAVVKNYTANPASLGTAVGTLRSTKILADALTTTSQNVYTFDFTNSGISSGIVLRGTSQILSLNFNGATLPLGLSIACNFEWSEE